jgi:hypothetical protein
MTPLTTWHRRRFGPEMTDRTIAALAAALAWVSVATTAAVGAAPERTTAAGTQQRQSTAARATTTVDPAVTPAGGHGCRSCGPAGCRPGHACGHRHHRDCRDGVCAPYCPVRPGTFGFYGTSWRKWPGQGVMPVSHQTEVTPALPPRSEVPGADEESFKSKASELPEPETADESAPPRAPTRPNAAARERPVREPAPATESEPAPERKPAIEPAPAPEPEAEPTPEPAAKPAPEPQPKAGAREPGRLPPGESPRPAADDSPPPALPESKPAPKPRPQDENLFDENAARVRRQIPVAGRQQHCAHQGGHGVPRFGNAREQPNDYRPPHRINHRARQHKGNDQAETGQMGHWSANGRCCRHAMEAL